MLADARAEARARISADELGERCAGVEDLARIPGADVTAELVGLLEEASWYLRDRVVAMLAERPDATSAIAASLATGTWFARASACDALGRREDPAALADVLAQIEDRNVSVQKSAIDAVERVAVARGADLVARALAARTPESRRRIRARIAHQSPEWSASLDAAFAAVPDVAITSRPRAVATGMSPAQEERAIVRFRKWLFSLPVSTEGRG